MRDKSGSAGYSPTLYVYGEGRCRLGRKKQKHQSGTRGNVRGMQRKIIEALT